MQSFQQITQPQPPADAVLVKIVGTPGAPKAEVLWPATAATPGGDYLYPTDPAVAFERARDVMVNYGYPRIVIWLASPELWDEAWGNLVP